MHAAHVVSASLEKPFSTEGGQGVVCPDARFYFGCRALDATRELQSWHRATADRRRPGGTTPGTMTLPTTPLQGSLVKNGVSFFNLDYLGTNLGMVLPWLFLLSS